jgi:hypothetical protein
MVRSVSKGIASAVMPPTLMNKLAKLSAQERKQIIGDFAAEVFHGLDPDPGLVAHLRKAAQSARSSVSWPAAHRNPARAFAGPLRVRSRRSWAHCPVAPGGMG